MSAPFYSVEQAYQYLCAVYNGYESLEQQILMIPPGTGNGYQAKILARQIIWKSEDWMDAKANLLYELMQLKYEQCEDFQNALHASGNRPLLHPVASPFWGTGPMGDGLNMTGKLLMDLRKKVSASVG